MENNQTFSQMFLAAKAMLAEKDPSEIANKAGVIFDGNFFQISSLGKTYRFSHPEYLCQESIGEWHYLTILHYLNLADGSPITGKSIAMADMPAGLVRGTKYDHTIAQALTAFLNGKTEEQVKQILQNLGGKIVQGKADLNVVLPFLPRFPLYLNIWFADEEFPPSARLLVDRCSPYRIRSSLYSRNCSAAFGWELGIFAFFISTNASLFWLPFRC